MAQGETVDRILNAATALFAERGFAETSLRTITGLANVNLAAVNYHFGSKKSLIQAVFTRFLQPFCASLERQMDALEADLQEGGKLTEVRLLSMIFVSLQEAMLELNEQPQRFMRLLGLAYTQSQDHLRKHLVQTFGRTAQRYNNWLREAMPHLDPIALYWRVNFVLGASIFTLSSFDSIQAILKDEHSVDMTMDDAIQMLIPALSGMLHSPHG
jgi:AcrR family transcriptional regulator